MTTPNPGDKAVCQHCGGEIIYVGPYWDHLGPLKPRHIAEPAGPIYASQTIPFTEISTRIFRYIAGQLTAEQLKAWFAPRFKTYPSSVQADIANSIQHLAGVMEDPKIKQTLTDLLPEEVTVTIKTWSFDDIYAKLKEFRDGELELSDLEAWLAPKISTLPQPVLSSVSVAIENLARAADDSTIAQALRDLLPFISSPLEGGTEGGPPEVLSVSVSDEVTPEDKVG